MLNHGVTNIGYAFVIQIILLGKGQFLNLKCLVININKLCLKKVSVCCPLLIKTSSLRKEFHFGCLLMLLLDSRFFTTVNASQKM